MPASAATRHAVAQRHPPALPTSTSTKANPSKTRHSLAPFLQPGSISAVEPHVQRLRALLGCPRPLPRHNRRHSCGRLNVPQVAAFRPLQAARSVKVSRRSVAARVQAHPARACLGVGRRRGRRQRRGRLTQLALLRCRVSARRAARGGARSATRGASLPGRLGHRARTASDDGGHVSCRHVAGMLSPRGILCREAGWKGGQGEMVWGGQPAPVPHLQPSAHDAWRQRRAPQGTEKQTRFLTLGSERPGVMRRKSGRSSSSLLVAR